MAHKYGRVIFTGLLSNVLAKRKKPPKGGFFVVL